jgi:hypothetical protein
MATVTLQWAQISWSNEANWSRNIISQLAEQGIKECDLDRAVYVIRLKPPFIIEYDKGRSPVVYIGEGNLQNRLKQHVKNWFGNLWDLIEKTGVSIYVCTPRVAGNGKVYKDVEAFLIHEFADAYGRTPLRNRQFEFAQKEHNFDLSQLRLPLSIGRGYKYSWALKPLKANPFYDDFNKAISKEAS